MDNVVREFSPSLSLGPNTSKVKLVLVLRELAEEARPHFQVLPP